MNKPNIIIFNPDEMRADAMGHMGNPAAITPNLDAFAKNDAVSFSNAFCQNPVCVPSRCSFLTGLYPHVHGHRTMENPIDGDCKPLFQELKEAGYYVWMNNRNDFLPNRDVERFRENADTTYIPAGPFVRVGDGNEEEHPNWTPQSFMFGIIPDETPEDVDRDMDTVRALVKFIKKRPKEQPFVAFAGLFNPHPPYGVEKRYYDAIDPSKIPARIPTVKDWTGFPSMMRYLAEKMNLQLEESDWIEMQRVYLAMCMKVDDMFGQLVAALKEEGIYDDTDIYVLSDHGDYVGDYGLPEKNQNTFQDALVRVPLLIKPHRGIEICPGTREGLTELIDFYATVMDLADVLPTHSHFGNSLRPAFTDETEGGRTYVFCEGGRNEDEAHCMEKAIMPLPSYEPRLSGQRDGVKHTRATMIRSAQHKYVRRQYEQDEFYDLKQDPQELRNEIDNPIYRERILEMKLAMLDWYQHTCDIVPYVTDGRRGNPMLTLIDQYLPEEKKERFRQLARRGGFTLEEFEEMVRRER